MTARHNFPPLDPTHEYEFGRLIGTAEGAALAVLDAHLPVGVVRPNGPLSAICREHARLGGLVADLYQPHFTWLDERTQDLMSRAQWLVRNAAAAPTWPVDEMKAAYRRSHAWGLRLAKAGLRSYHGVVGVAYERRLHLAFRETLDGRHWRLRLPTIRSRFTIVGNFKNLSTHVPAKVLRPEVPTVL